MANTQTLDMTRGKPLPILVRFALPLILGSLFQQLYSFVDTVIVGRCISADALRSGGSSRRRFGPPPQRCPVY